MKWKHYIKPEILVCPEEFCIFWNDKGSLVSHGLFDDLDEALRNTTRLTYSSCGCSFGNCRRDLLGGINDWFEPVEPLHEKCMLPYFYFSDYSTLNEEDKEKHEQYFSFNTFS